jgi:hypothetical protein
MNGELMKALILMFFLLAPNVSFGLSFDCSIEHKDAKLEKNKKIWSGTLTTKGKSGVEAAAVIIKKDGTAFSMMSLLMNELNGSAVSTLADELKPYDGLMVLGLKLENGLIYLNSSHVDISNHSNMAPFDAMGWTSIASKKMGIKDFKKDLEFTCTQK